MQTNTHVAWRRQNVRKALLVISFLFFPVTFYCLSLCLIIMGVGERTASV
jgi:hypothetical protein